MEGVCAGELGSLSSKIAEDTEVQDQAPNITLVETAVVKEFVNVRRYSNFH